MSQDFEFTDQHSTDKSIPPAESNPTPPPSAPSPPPTRPISPGKPVEAHPASSNRSPLAIMAGLVVVLAALAGGAAYYLGLFPKTEDHDASGASASPVAKEGANPSPASAAPGRDLAAEVEGLKSSLKAATDRIDAMAAKPGPDVKSLEDRLAAIEKAQQALAGLPDRLASLEEKVKAEPAGGAMARIDAVEKRVGEVAQAIDAVKAEVAAMARPASSPASGAEAAKPEDINMADQALSQGADLFKQKKYAESLDVFTKLQADHPEDARVWYFSALANGLATRDWAGETVRWVTKGVEREKAGTPEASKIDAVFSGLTTATGKDWLAAYRARAASR